MNKTLGDLPVCPFAVSKMARRGLMEQDLSKLDVTKPHPLSPEVISRQATINIGMDTILYYCNWFLYVLMYELAMLHDLWKNDWIILD